MQGNPAPRARRRGGRTRLVTATGAILAAGALITAATITDSADVTVAIDGSRNTFDLVVSGSVEPGWSPSAADWDQGNPDAFQIALTDDGSGYVLAPGAALDVRVAARNASPRLAGTLRLTILDPDPRGNSVDPETGRQTELYDQLVFTVRDADTVIYDHVLAGDLETYTWDAPLSAGDDTVLDVRIEMPASLGNEWQLASTDVQFHFEAVNV